MSPKTHCVYLGLGSNVHARENIASGIDALDKALSNLELSPAYRTRAIGFDGDDFINLVARGNTSMQPLELKSWLNDLENRHGRTRDVPKFSDRTLDIDILLFDDLWTRLPGLEIPRPEIEEFAHVLKPLADLAPNLIHPATGITLNEIWQGFKNPPAMEEIIPSS
ncbi:MAG TPA: 2-amino-4-hydroxy-6-hydroxymethyldihydropteridine diphosphokinase [Xanthomonadales bacterium]|nr:2-amino-4-hydroxy-6-hydroxymethyldihydropteridine diphosphokinase [Xanthomonadales bacterium]